jgi:hypothetical protein
LGGCAWAIDARAKEEVHLLGHPPFREAPVSRHSSERYVDLGADLLVVRASSLRPEAGWKPAPQDMTRTLDDEQIEL